MNENVKVSVIIPVYKVEKYIRDCIDSVICQSHENLEIILVDDGSPDNCPSICDDYGKRDPRIKVIHKNNGGLSSARNAGLREAKGDYVYFLDSDDYIAKHAIELLVNEARQSNSQIVLFDSYVVNENDSGLYTNDFYMRKGEYSNAKRGCLMFLDMLDNYEYYTAVPLMFFSTEYLKKHEIVFVEGILHEDELFSFVAFLKCPQAVHMGVPLYYRRVREDSIMTNRVTHRNYEGIIKIFEILTQMYFSEDDEGRKKIIACEILNIINIANLKYDNMSHKERQLAKASLSIYKSKFEEFKKDYGEDALKKYLRNPLYKAFVRLLKKVGVAENVVKIKTIHTNKKAFSSYVETLRRSEDKDKRLILIGSPMHGNLGDHAIAWAEVRFFNTYFKDYSIFEIPTPVYNSLFSKIRKAIKTSDIILISGGGWLGDIWIHNENTVRDIVTRYPKNRVIILPQTVYFSNNQNSQNELVISKQIFNKHKALTLFVRDKNSLDFSISEKYVPQTIYAPDMALFGFAECPLPVSREGCLLCFRKDRERVEDPLRIQILKQNLFDMFHIVKWTTTVYLKGIHPSDREQRLSEKLAEYSQAKVVITDRLHSMIFAVLTGTPCVVIDNLTKKISGVLEWIQGIEYVRIISSLDEIDSAIDSMDLNQIYRFDPQKYRISDGFTNMVKCISNIIEDSRWG